jgi:hypothetical protein
MLAHRPADQFMQIPLGLTVAVDNGRFGPLFHVQHELQGEPCAARPVGMRHLSAVTDQIAFDHGSTELERGDAENALGRQ